MKTEKFILKILKDLGKYEQMLEKSEIPLEITGMQMNPKYCGEGSLLIILLGPKYVVPNSYLKEDEVKFIVEIKKSD